MDIIYEDSDIRVVGETIQDLGFMVHCTVQRWAGSVYRKLLWILLKLATEHRVVYGISINEKQNKFMEILGFTPCDQQVISIDNIVYNTYKFEVEQWKQQ